MFIACAIASVLLAAMLALSASLKLREDERSVATIHELVGVPLRWFPVLAGLELAGALGVLVGLGLAPLGIAASVGLVLYFVGAIIGHLRVGDTKGIGNPAIPLVLAAVVLVLRIASA